MLPISSLNGPKPGWPLVLLSIPADVKQMLSFGRGYSFSKFEDYDRLLGSWVPLVCENFTHLVRLLGASGPLHILTAQ